MNILVPVDFSPASDKAAHYAAHVALALNAPLTVLHAVHFDTQSQTQVAMKAHAIEDKMLENAREDCAAFAAKLHADFPALKLNHETIKSYPLHEVLNEYATGHQTDLIIMGTKGASGIKKVLIGSNAVAVINHSHVPVLTVPEDAAFDGVRAIVYASDTLHIEDEMPEVVRFAQPFGAAIHFLHVLAPSTVMPINTAKLTEMLKTKYPEHQIQVHIIPGEKILDGIEQCVKETGAQIVAMFTHQPTFLERLFGKSITRQMAFHTSTPLLSLKKKKN